MTQTLPKLAFSLFFFVLGLVSSLFQMVLLREVLVSFRGSELFLTYFLASWLILVGLGSLIGNRWPKTQKLNALPSFYYLLTGFAAISLFLSIRILPQALNSTVEAPNLLVSLLILPSALFPLALLLGGGFSWGSRYFGSLSAIPPSSGTNRAYLIETFGFFLGSLTFNFWLIKFAAFKMVMLAVAVSLAGTLAIIFANCNQKLRRGFLALVTLFVFLVAGLLLIKGQDYETKTTTWRLPLGEAEGPKERLIKSVNSFYGNIAVTEKEGQYNFYEQGFLTSPLDDFQTAEELTHLPLLFAPKAQRVLIIGNAWNGYLKEFLKYPKLEIYYLEADPQFLPTIFPYLDTQKQKDLQNSRVKVLSQDILSFLKDRREKFDLILSNLPLPTNYQINRYYTEEFFRLAEKSLTSTGIFAFGLPYHQENLSNFNTNRLLSSIFKSFKSSFSNNSLIPGQKLIVIGVANNNIQLNNAQTRIQDLLQRFGEQKIETKFLSPKHIEYLLANERRLQILKEITKPQAQANSSLMPMAVIYQLANQIESKEPRAAGLINQIIRLRWLGLWLAAVLPFCIVLFLIRKKRNNWTENKIKLIACFAGPLSIILEIAVIFIWQVEVGYVFQQVSLIIGLVMLGIFLANLHFFLKPPHDHLTALKRSLGFILGLGVALLIYLLVKEKLPLGLNKIVLLGSALASGYFTGRIYPLTNWLYLNKKPAPIEETGKIYGLELLGGALILTTFSLFILPFFGLLAFTGFLIYWTSLNYLLAFHFRKLQDFTPLQKPGQ